MDHFYIGSDNQTLHLINLYQKDKENLELTVAVPGYKQYEIPEEQKPQKIAIGQNSKPEVIEHKK